jgi:CubicO group peptidase (beta-lactamase class C family)
LRRVPLKTWRTSAILKSVSRDENRANSAAHGKEAITPRHLLSHTAGLAGIRKPLTREAFYDWPAMTAALADETPWWEPGTANGYHALTYGYLVGELVRRIDGRTIGKFLREEVTAPLDIDFHIGLPASEDARVAEMVPPTAAEAACPEAGAGVVDRRRDGQPPMHPTVANLPEWRAGPAANGHGNARSVARPWLRRMRRRPRRRAPARAQRSSAPSRSRSTSRISFSASRSGASASCSTARRCRSRRMHTFGHGGWGARRLRRLDAGASWAYVMNKMTPGTAGDNRAFPIILAFYSAL